MRAIALSCVVGVFACSALTADANDEVIDLFGAMATALSDIDVPAFMNAFDKNMPDYDTIKTGVTALVRQADVTSSIEPLTDDGDDTHRTVEMDWYLEIRSLLPDGPLVRRREVVQCELRKEKKHWKIVALKPVAFFAPAKMD
jgi:hypothetical protein